MGNWKRPPGGPLQYKAHKDCEKMGLYLYREETTQHKQNLSLRHLDGRNTNTNTNTDSPLSSSKQKM